MSESSADAVQQSANAEIKLAAPSWIVLILLALTPPLFATGFSNFELFKELVLVGGVGLALVLWGIQALRNRAVSMMAGRVTVLMLVFGLYTLAACLWADNQLLGLWHSLHFVALAGVVLIITSPVGRPLRFYDFAVATGVGAAIAGIFGLLDLAGVGVFTVVWNPPGATGAFDAMEFAGAYYVVALPILLGAIFRFPGRSRIFFAVCFGLAGFHFALTSGWGWGAIFAAVCVAAVLLVFAFQRAEAVMVLTPVVVLLGVIAVFLAIAQWGLPQPEATSYATSLPYVLQPEEAVPNKATKARVENPVFSADRTESVQSALARSYLLDVGTSLFSERPIIGHGAGSWWPLQTKRPHIDHPFVQGMFATYPAFRSPHDGAITLLVEYGLIGLVLFVLWLAAAFAVTLGALGRRTERVGWITEHWALLTAGLAGLTFMLFTPLLELAPAALTWVGAMAVLTRFSASLNDFRGWSSVWAARTGEEGGPSPVTGAAVLAILIGAGILVPTFLNTVAGYYRGRADQFMLDTLYSRAIASYRQVDDWYPAFGDVPLNIGIASSRTGELDKATDAVKRAVELRPYDVRALVLRGRVQMGTSNRVPTIRMGKRALAAFPNSVAATDLLVSAYDVNGHYNEAISQADDFLKRDPPKVVKVKLHMLAGDIYKEVLKQPAEAAKHYKQALQMVENPQRRAKLQKKISELEKAVKQQRRMREGKSPVPGPSPARKLPQPEPVAPTKKAPAPPKK